MKMALRGLQSLRFYSQEFMVRIIVKFTRVDCSRVRMCVFNVKITVGSYYFVIAAGQIYCYFQSIA